MVWLIVLAAAVVLTVVGLGRVRIPREAHREGEIVVAAYARLSRSWAMKMARWITLRRLAQLKPAGLVLDAGCGPGFLAEAIARRFPEVRLVAIDIDLGMVGFARRIFPSVAPALAVSDMRRLPFAEGALDLVVSTATLHHLPNASLALAEFHRVLKPGGQLLIVDMRRDTRRFFYWSVILAQVFMPREIGQANGAVGSFWASFTVKELETMMEKSGFAEWEVRPGVGWVFVTARK